MFSQIQCSLVTIIAICLYSTVMIVIIAKKNQKRGDVEMMNGEIIARIRGYTRNFPIVDSAVQAVDNVRIKVKSKVEQFRSRI